MPEVGLHYIGTGRGQLHEPLVILSIHVVRVLAHAGETIVLELSGIFLTPIIWFEGDAFPQTTPGVPDNSCGSTV